MLESFERVCYLRHHLKLHLVVVVVPIRIQPQVPFALPIVGGFVVLSEDCHEVPHVFFADIFHTKIIRAKQEGDQAPVVCTKSWCYLTLVIALLVQ